METMETMSLRMLVDMFKRLEYRSEVVVKTSAEDKIEMYKLYIQDLEHFEKVFTLHTDLIKEKVSMIKGKYIVRVNG